MLVTASCLVPQELGAEKQLPGGPDARGATGCHCYICSRAGVCHGILVRWAHQNQAEAQFLQSTKKLPFVLCVKKRAYRVVSII